MSDHAGAPILFDGSILGDGPITGVGRSFLYTLRAYAARGDARCVLLAPATAPSAELELPGVELRSGLPPRGWRRRAALRAAIAEFEPALLHSPVGAVPLRRCPTCVTVHDVPWLYAELRGEPGSRLSQRLALRQAVRHADALIVPSAATGDDVRRCHGDRGRLIVIPHGVPVPSSPADDHALQGPFLVLGDDRPRKNHARLRAAHADARRQCTDLPDLRFLGPPTAYASEADKTRVLRQSRALLHLALLEGFGLPVVEAFGHGVPVVCSDRTALPEVAGGAALLVDPTDIAQMAAAMIRVHRDRELRRDLRARGLVRARQLSPERAAQAWHELHAAIV